MFTLTMRCQEEEPVMTNRLTLLHFCSSVRRKGALAICLALCTLVLGISARAQGPTFTTFDAPGAGTAAGQGTFGLGINPHGTIAGIYVDANYAYHGFLRAKSGNITTFDAPGAGTGPFQGTFAVGLNLSGAIAGYYPTAASRRLMLRTQAPPAALAALP